MSRLTPTKPSVLYRSDSSDNLSNAASSVGSTEMSRKIYTINELMRLRNGNSVQPARLFATPIVDEILRRDLDLKPTYILFPQMQMDSRQFQNQSNRHNTRSIEELNPRNGSHSQKRHNNDNVRIHRSSSSEIRIRFQEDVKLNKAENAWTPSMFVDRKAAQDVVDELYRQVRGILNKLTAKNFDVMLDQFKEVVIDTKEKLDGFINLVFNKAVNEPNFSVGYAHLCKHLATCWDKMKGNAQDADFKRTFITKCQHEFEQHVANEHLIEAALGPLNDKLNESTSNNDAKKTAEIKCQIIEEEANVRRRMVSTVRFIGELYKLDMLKTEIMNWCITKLIDSGTDEKLECVCELLTTIGEKLERKPTSDSDASKKQFLDLTPYMKQLRQISDRKNGKNKVGTRVRFMILDLLELRANHWKPKLTGQNESLHINKVVVEEERELAAANGAEDAVLHASTPAAVRLCTVCNRTGSGVHYGVFSCDGCRKFFARTVRLKLQFVCLFSENCAMPKTGKAWCKLCRFNKCLSSGMFLTLAENK